MVKYALVINWAELSAEIQEVDMGDIWRPSKPNGWTYNQVAGPHGSVHKLCESYEEARQIRAEVLGF